MKRQQQKRNLNKRAITKTVRFVYHLSTRTQWSRLMFAHTSFVSNVSKNGQRFGNYFFCGINLKLIYFLKNFLRVQKINTCPIDRRKYSYLELRDRNGLGIVERIKVEDRTNLEDQESLNDLTFCEICNQSTREDRMLLCDGCDLGFHCELFSFSNEYLNKFEWTLNFKSSF